jgi:4-hydroxy-tetrahydrodipicolinate synthase
MAEFEGIFVVTMSPFKDGQVDERAVRQMVDHFVDAGVQGLVVLGSNGENPYLTDGEKRQLIDVTVDQARGRVPVIAGTGCTGTDATIELTRHARDAGADAALVALPQYFRVGFEDVRRHFTRLVQEVGLPVLYYNFPAVTRLELTPAEIAELAAIPGMVGVKQTIFDLEEIAELAKLTEEMPFSVLSGTVLNLPALVPRGVRGAIGVLPNLMPRESVALYNALRDGDDAAASGLMASIGKLARILAANPIAHATLKEALRQMGHPFEPTVKDPLPPLTAEQRDLVAEVLADLKLVA